MLLNDQRFNKMDVIICEFGGDFIGGNADRVLQDSDIMKYVSGIVLTYYDLAGIIAANRMWEEWGINLNTTYIAHNIFRNITAINQRLEYWRIPFEAFNVNKKEEQIRLSKKILNEVVGGENESNKFNT
jgi:hypothetical protein